MAAGRNARLNSGNNVAVPRSVAQRQAQSVTGGRHITARRSGEIGDEPLKVEQWQPPAASSPQGDAHGGDEAARRGVERAAFLGEVRASRRGGRRCAARRGGEEAEGADQGGGARNRGPAAQPRRLPRGRRRRPTASTRRPARRARASGTSRRRRAGRAAAARAAARRRARGARAVSRADAVGERRAPRIARGGCRSRGPDAHPLHVAWRRYRAHPQLTEVQLSLEGQARHLG